MAYFECTTGMGAGGGATITVTYSSSFYNKTMTCSNGTKTYTKTTTSSGSTEFKVSDGGTWTITCNGTSVSVYVTLAYTTSMKPDGSTVTPINDVQIWLKCASINKNYTTVNQVLADATTLLGLISDNNAVNYMVRSTSFASSICSNATAMTDIGANNYCANTLLANSTWCTAICNSTYFESVLNVKVPNMTSNTAPSGVVSASSVYQSGSDFPAWKAFNSTEAKGYVPNASDSTPWIQYDFGSSVQVNRVYTKGLGGSATTVIYTAKLKGSRDNFVSDTHDIASSITVEYNGYGTAPHYFNIPNVSGYRYIRLAFTNTTTGAYTTGQGMKLQFYGR